MLFFFLLSSSIFQHFRIDTSGFRLGFCYMNMNNENKYDTKLFTVQDNLINLEITGIRDYLFKEMEPKEEQDINNNQYTNLISHFIVVVKYVLTDHTTFVLSIDANDIHFSDKNFIDFIVELKKTMKTQFSPFHEKTIVKNCSPIVKSIMKTFFRLFLDKSEMNKVGFI